MIAQDLVLFLYEGDDNASLSSTDEVGTRASVLLLLIDAEDSTFEAMVVVDLKESDLMDPSSTGMGLVL